MDEHFQPYSTTSEYILRVTINDGVYYFLHRKKRPRNIELIDDIMQATSFYSAHHAKDEATIHLTTANGRGYGVELDKRYMQRLAHLEVKEGASIKVHVGQCILSARTPLYWHELVWDPENVHAL